MTAQANNLSDKSYWGKQGGYYDMQAEELRRNPLPLPDRERASFRKLEQVFLRHLPKDGETRLMEIGCGGSRFLPYFAKVWSYRVAGIDYEEYAAQLAQANLEGHGVEDATVYCHDLFDTQANRDLYERYDVVFSAGVIEHFEDGAHALGHAARFLRPGGLIVTTVPNFRGVNGLVQRWIDQGILDMHVLHTEESLRQSHEDAGFVTLESDYFGVYNGWLTENALTSSALKKKLHHLFCLGTNVLVDRALRATRYSYLPEHRWVSPYIVYVGRKTG